MLRLQPQPPNAAAIGGDGGLPRHDAAVLHLRHQHRRLARRGQHLAGDRERVRRQRDRLVERAGQLRQRRQEQVAEVVPGELPAREPVLEHVPHERLVLGQRDQAGAHVAGRRDVEVAPQPAGRAAVIGQRHDRGRLLTDRLQPAQHRRQARAAAEADDPRAPHRCSPSWRSSRSLYAFPSGPHSPMLPSARITRWYGTTSERVPRAQTEPAARCARSAPPGSRARRRRSSRRTGSAAARAGSAPRTASRRPTPASARGRCRRTSARSPAK